MTISNELSSDVAIAIFEKNRSPQELKQLKDIILQVHSELQKMSEAMHADRLKRTEPHRGRKAANGT
jgi:hypothetical protein